MPARAWMQAGTFVTVPVAAGLALVGRRPRLARGLAVGGTAAWLLAKAAKPLAGRPRPDGLLEHVRIREKIAGDLGWVSGHTAVATTLIVTAWPWLPTELRPYAAATVAATGFGRMYVGAHLPLDLVGGAGLGLVIGGFVRTRSDPPTRGRRVVASADPADNHALVGRERVASLKGERWTSTNG